MIDGFPMMVDADQVVRALKQQCETVIATRGNALRWIDCVGNNSKRRQRTRYERCDEAGGQEKSASYAQESESGD